MKILKIIWEANVIKTLIIWPISILIGWFVMSFFEKSLELLAWHPDWSIEWILIWILVVPSIGIGSTVTTVLGIGIVTAPIIYVYKDLVIIIKRIKNE